jgi:hypothetical protein
LRSQSSRTSPISSSRRLLVAELVRLVFKLVGQPVVILSFVHGDSLPARGAAQTKRGAANQK